MAQRLLRSGHKVTMVCGSYQGGDTGLTQAFEKGRRGGTVDGIDVIEFDLSYSNADGLLKRTGIFLRYSLGATGIALRSKADVLFATSTPLTVGIPAVIGRWLGRHRMVFEVRDLWPELPRAMGVIKNPVVLWGMSVLEFMSYRSAHRCVALSPGIRDGILARGVPDDRVAAVPNGCDLNIFAKAEDRAWRPTEVAKTDLMAVFSGTHGQANGLDAVLDAAAELKARGRKDIKLVLIGNGKLKPQLVERATRENLDNVVFHDPVPKQKIAGLLASADIGMQILADVPAFYDGTSPNKFFDYIATGLPVLNNYPGWLAKAIQSSGCGFTVPPEDPKAFADALVSAADNRDQLKEMGHAARTLAARDFDRDLLGERWVNWVTGAGKSK
tara:strand:- start:3256 stop:4413 length:1158 start_codon:yes stop_codon:yes gene_type:complete